MDRRLQVKESYLLIPEEGGKEEVGLLVVVWDVDWVLI
jgi:hypothetical protein